MRVIRHEVARRFAIVTHGGMPAHWVIPAQASAELAVNMPTGGQVVHRVIRPQLGADRRANSMAAGSRPAIINSSVWCTKRRRIALGVVRDRS
jgi:hypothetical protein